MKREDQGAKSKMQDQRAEHPAQERNIIEVRNLSFGYERDLLNLKNISMDIGRGKITAILGGNGAGKSTLFLNLNGILEPRSGEIYIEGNMLRQDKKSLLHMRENVGIVFQDPDDQLFSADVYRDISFGAVNLGLPQEEVDRRVGEAMEKTGVTHLAQRPTHALSYGQKKRVAIAGILVMEPKVIILDEPTAGLDPQGVRDILDLLKKLKEDKEMSIVIATHDMDLVPEFSDYVYVLKDGEITLQGTPKEVFAHPEPIEANNLRMPILGALVHQLAQEDKLDIDLSALLMEEVRAEIRRLAQGQPKS